MKPLNEPAFPRPGDGQSCLEGNRQDGMSLRDYFAAAFLQGFASTYQPPDAPITIEHQNNLAKTAYQVADTMLRKRHNEI